MKRKWITFTRIVQAGAFNFIRNASLAIAAVAVMVVMLTIILFSLIANATFTNSIKQITDKIDLSIFLKDTVTPVQAEDLIDQLEKHPDVKKVTFFTKDEATKSFSEQNKDNPNLAIAIQTYAPAPATIRVMPENINDVSSINNFISKPEIAALQSNPSTYNGELRKAIDDITQATNVLQRIGLIAVGVFAVVSVLIIFNTIQMAIFNRRDEISIMRLLGASTSYIRGPFVVESIIYGLVAALISIGVIKAAFVASSSALQASSLGLLDIVYASRYFNDHFWIFLTLQIAIGIIIGAVSSVIATRRYLKFKTK